MQRRWCIRPSQSLRASSPIGGAKGFFEAMGLNDKSEFIAPFSKIAPHPWLPLWGSCPNGTERAVGSIILVHIAVEPFCPLIILQMIFLRNLMQGRRCIQPSQSLRASSPIGGAKGFFEAMGLNDKSEFIAPFSKIAPHPWLPLWGSCPNGTERAVGSIILVHIAVEPFCPLIILQMIFLRNLMQGRRCIQPSQSLRASSP